MAKTLEEKKSVSPVTAVRIKRRLNVNANRNNRILFSHSVFLKIYILEQVVRRPREHSVHGLCRHTNAKYHCRRAVGRSEEKLQGRPTAARRLRKPPLARWFLINFK